jgi:DNA modification methylase
MDKYLNQVVCKSAIDLLKDLPDQSVHCIITSPPYFGLRDYGTAKWEGGDSDCKHRVGNQVEDNKAKNAITSGVRPGVDASTCILCGAKRIDDQIGLEQTPEQYVDRLVEIFHEAKRVLRNDGILWLNLGDSFSSGKQGRDDSDRNRRLRGDKTDELEGNIYVNKSRRVPSGYKSKDLLGIPFRVAFALQEDGWYWRSTIPWVKRNAMPESVKDRPTSGVEYVFMFSKSQKYYYDYSAIQRPLAESSISRVMQKTFDEQTGGDKDYGKGTNTSRSARKALENFASNIRFGGNKADGYGNETYSGKRWVAGKTRRYRNTDSFYDSLDILIEETQEYLNYLQKVKENHGVLFDEGCEIVALDVPTRSFKAAHFATFPPTLIEPLLIAGCPVGGVVLDFFGGAGTVGLVASQNGRQFVCGDLNPEYVEMAQKRILDGSGWS